MAESKEELKSLLIKVKESEKAGLEINIQKLKIMSSSPISSWKMCVSCSVKSDSLWPMGYSQPGSSVHGFLQARILESAAISYSKGLSDPGIEPKSPALQADFLMSEPLGKLGHPKDTEKSEPPHRKPCLKFYQASF